MKNTSNRRRFLIACTGAGIVGAAVPLGIYSLDSKNRLRGLIQSMLENNLPGTTVSQADVERFAADFFVKDDKVTLNNHIFSVLDPVIRVASQYDDGLRARVYDFERKVISNFLLNSDFFATGSDRKSVTYYGTSERICSAANPFAQFLSQ